MFGSDAELALRASVGDNTYTHNSDSDYRLKTSGRTAARENKDEFGETMLKKMAAREKYCVQMWRRWNCGEDEAGPCPFVDFSIHVGSVQDDAQCRHVGTIHRNNLQFFWRSVETYPALHVHRPYCYL